MKTIQRRLALQKRNALSYDEQQMKSRQICEQLLPYLKGTIAIYQSFSSEVKLDALHLVQIALPVVDEDCKMHFVACDETTSYQKNKYGILEPQSDLIVDPQSIDVMVIPLVAFDRNKQRIGYGKGYYDRYLPHTSCLKIGVAFACQEVDEVETDAYDQSLDMIITELECIK